MAEVEMFELCGASSPVRKKPKDKNDKGQLRREEIRNHWIGVKLVEENDCVFSNEIEVVEWVTKGIGDVQFVKVTCSGMI